MRRSSGDACCDCLSLCGVYCFLGLTGIVELVAWVALQPVLHFIEKPDHRPCLTPEGSAAENPNRTNLKFIVPSAGVSGTTSLHTAFCMLGLRSFHAEERFVFAPESWVDEVSAEVMARSVSRCRLDVFFLESTTDVFPRILEVSPGARIIMTWRDWPSYYRSVTTHWQPVQDLAMYGIGVLSVIPVRMIRWVDWWDAVSGGMITDAMRRAECFGCPGKAEGVMYFMVPLVSRMLSLEVNMYDRGTFKIYFDEESYLAQHDEIRRLVPPENLLVFNVRRHSWKELEEFSGISAGELSKTKFPNPRKSNLLTHNHILQNNLGGHAAFYLFTSSLATVEVLLLLPLLRLLRPFLCACCRARHRERWSSKRKEA